MESTSGRFGNFQVDYIAVVEPGGLSPETLPGEIKRSGKVLLAA